MDFDKGQPHPNRMISRSHRLSDLDMPAQHYEVVGSDRSQAFLDRYAANHPDTELSLLDAATIEIDQTFDAVYSNKVLHRREAASRCQLVAAGDSADSTSPDSIALTKALKSASFWSA